MKNLTYAVLEDGQDSTIEICPDRETCNALRHDWHCRTFARAKQHLLDNARDHVHSWRRTCGKIRRMKKGDL